MKTHDLQLVSHILCPYVQRSVIVLMEKGIPFTRTDINLDKPPAWFSNSSPMGKVPVLVVDKKKSLFESSVICEYIDEITSGSLHSEDHLEKAYHRAWIEFGSEILNNIGCLYNAKDKQEFDDKLVDISGMFILIEKELGNGPYFSGEQFHIIDAVFGPIFRYFEVFKRIIKLHIFSETPKVETWRNALLQRTSVINAVSPNYPELLLQFFR